MRRPYVNPVSEALRRYQVDHQITQPQMAELIGLTRRAVQGLEEGSQRPSLRTLRAMARVFQWTPAEVGQVVLSMPMQRQVFAGVVYGTDRPGIGLAQRGGGVDVGRGGAVGGSRPRDDRETEAGSGSDSGGGAEAGAGL
jgi:DNA-binding XRE family transcriptional regulator